MMERELWMDRSELIREASDLLTHPSRLAELALNPDVDVRLAVVCNPATPAQTAKTMEADSYLMIRFMAPAHAQSKLSAQERLDIACLQADAQDELAAGGKGPCCAALEQVLVGIEANKPNPWIPE